MANQQVKTTTINGKITGVLEEKALELQTGVQKTPMEGKPYTTDIIKGKLVVNGYEINVFSQSHTTKGENKMFKSLKTVFDSYVDKVQAAKEGLEPDTVEVAIKYECNDYPSPTQSPTEIKTGIRISYFKANRVPKETPSQAELDIDGAVIRTMVAETKDEEETGRLLVEVATFDYTGRLKPFKFIVENGSEEDGLDTLVEDFESTFQAGQTVRIYCELKKIQIGGETTKKKAAFGKKADVSSGYTIIEAHIIGGEEPYEEDDEKTYDLKDVKEAMNQRNEELEAMLKKAQEDAKKPKDNKASLGGAGNKSAGGKGAVGKKAQVPPTTNEDDDCPF